MLIEYVERSLRRESTVDILPNDALYDWVSSEADSNSDITWE